MRPLVGHFTAQVGTVLKLEERGLIGRRQGIGFGVCLGLPERDKVDMQPRSGRRPSLVHAFNAAPLAS